MRGRLVGVGYKCRKRKCLTYCKARSILNRKEGACLQSKSIARRAGLRWMGRTQKVRMFKRIPRNPKKYCIRIILLRLRANNWHPIENVSIWNYLSKSVYGIKAKNNLSFWNMNARSARKAMREKVWVGATLRDCNLWIPQGRMYWKEIYETFLQEFAGSHWNRCCS